MVWPGGWKGCVICCGICWCLSAGNCGCGRICVRIGWMIGLRGGMREGRWVLLVCRGFRCWLVARWMAWVMTMEGVVLFHPLFEP